MYVPYLRGRAAELRALMACEHLIVDEYVFPIIEPCKGTNELWSKLRRMVKREIPCALIVNPEHDKLGKDSSPIHKFLEEKAEKAVHIYPTLHIRADVGRGEVEQFLEYYKFRYVALVLSSDHIKRDELEYMIGDSESVDLIAVEAARMPLSYIPKTHAHVVLIKDGFRAASENAAYPDENYFSELVNTYLSLGYVGFGDYQTIGEPYDPKGYIPKAVTIHFSYESSTPGIVRVKHFVSTDRKEQVQGLVAKKTKQALEKLRIFVEETEPFCASGCASFLRAVEDEKPPQLLALKQWSIQHHIELMNHLTGRELYA